MKTQILRFGWLVFLVVVSGQVSRAQGSLLLNSGTGQYDLINAVTPADGKPVFIRNSTELWKTDGTVAGTQKITDLSSKPVEQLVAVGNIVYFKIQTNGATKLWKTDGTVQGTKPVTTGNGPPPGNVNKTTMLGNALLFFASTDTTNFAGLNTSLPLTDFTQRLWRTDGTDAGTKLLTIRYGTVGAMYPADSLVIFILGDKSGFGTAAPVSQYGGGIYRTDGTASGTRQISGDTKINGTIYGLKDALYVSNNTDIWRLGYSPGSTAQLIPGLGTGESYKLLGKAGNQVFVQKNRIVSGKDDGTDLRALGGTNTTTPVLIKSFAGTDKLVINNNTIAFKNSLLFAGTNAVNGTEPWISDGTTTGTKLLKDLSPGTATGIFNSAFSPLDLSVGIYFGIVKEYAYFYGFDGSNSYLYRTDGATVDITPNSPSTKYFSSTSGIVSGNNKIFYSFEPYPIVSSKYGLWVFDPGAAPVQSCSLTASISGNITLPCTVNATTSLTASTTGGTAPFTYQWQRNGANISGATSATYAANAVGDYTVLVTDGKNCPATSAKLTLIGPGSVAATITGSTTLCTGQPATLSASLTNGTAPYTYQWKQNGNVVGSNAASLSISTGGTYSLSVTDACSSTTASFSVSAMACANPMVLLPPGGATATSPITITASTGLTGGADAGTTFQWLLNSNPIAGATGATYTASASGSYAVAVTLGGRVTTSPAIMLTINVVLAIEPLGLTENQVTVYPNPTTGECQVMVEVATRQAATLYLTDALGKTVRQWKAQLGPKLQPLRVTMPESDGLYFLRVETEKGAVVTKIIRSR